MMPLAKRTAILPVVARLALALLIGMLATVQPAPAQIYASSSCATGEAVTDAPNNPGLASDCETLLSARDTLQGDTSTRMMADPPDGTGTLNWSASIPMAEWTGVELRGSPVRVRTVRLPRRLLAGSIPELDGLEELEELHLDRNQLTGPLPPDLGRLPNLQVLNLAGNELTEGIPPELGRLTNLQALDLAGNELVGEIPAELGNLHNLMLLQVRGNHLSGEIPSELGKLTNLRGLGLTVNQLSGEIPASLGDLNQLYWLSLQFNQLTGHIPRELGKLTKLRDLSLGVSGRIGHPPVGNRLTGPIPAELGRLENLRTLALGRNQLEGPIPAELGELIKLEELYLNENQLDGPIPAELGNLSNLTDLALSANELTGEIPDTLGNLNELVSLRLEDNQLAGEIPASLGNLSKLFYLYLGNNQLTGRIPTEFEGLSRLGEIDLSDNQLSGPVPAELGSLDLQGLHLERNQLTGPVPIQLANAHLLRMDLSHNQLTGEIPAVELASAELDLSHNQLTGPIPEELINIPSMPYFASLESLLLNDNQLTGSIPAKLGNLPNLEELHLNDNRVTGPIPTGLGSVATLQGLLLAGNQLSGCIPDGLQGVTANDLASVGLPFCAPVRRSMTGKYDLDGDGLIEISFLEQLDAVRHDPDGDGEPVTHSDDRGEAYAVAFPTAGREKVCGYCNGYELSRSLDFTDPTSYSSGVVSTEWTAGGGWVPINDLHATLDGNGHTISNLYIYLSTDEPTFIGRTGLIALTFETSIVRNIGLVDAQVEAQGGAAALVGENFGVISDSYATGSVLGFGVWGAGRTQLRNHRQQLLHRNSVRARLRWAGWLRPIPAPLRASYSTGNVSGRQACRRSRRRQLRHDYCQPCIGRRNG